MKQNDQAMKEPNLGDFCADAVRAGFAGPALYATTVTAALIEESMHWIDQWCSLSTRFCYAGPLRAPPFELLFGRMAGVEPSRLQAPVGVRMEVSDLFSAQGPDEGNYPDLADVDAFEDVDDLPPITEEEMLAHPRSMEFNIALHEMQERLFAGLPMGGKPDEPPPGYEPEHRPGSRDRKTEPYEL